MAEMNRRVVLANRPSGMVDDQTVRVESDPRPEPAAGEALVKVGYLSIDPTIRTWMNDAPGYLPPIGIGEVIRSGGIGEVVESTHEGYGVGDLVFGMTGWQEYAVISGGDRSWQQLPAGIDAPTALNVFGINGMTAYFGLLEVGRMAEGDTVVVSGAAGATGSTVGQIAKLKGAGKVVGIAGGPEKCAYVVEKLGFDAAVDYKAPRLGSSLHEHCPNGIDVYFDNVGGTILNTALAQLAMRGRVVLCGAISAYNATERIEGPANYINLIPKRGRMEGFLVFDYARRYPEAQGEILTWLLEGKLNHDEHVVEGLENAPKALNLLFTGGNTGKVVVKL
jgi:NADPH-dependent curcumin reductase CurA